jgi:hypothetical protein
MQEIFQNILKECMPILEDMTKVIEQKRVFEYLKKFEGKYIIRSAPSYRGGYGRDNSFMDEPVFVRLVTPFYMIVRKDYSPINSNDDDILAYEKFMDEKWVLFVPPKDGYKKYNCFGELESTITHKEQNPEFEPMGHFECGKWVDDEPDFEMYVVEMEDDGCYRRTD